VAGHQGLLYQKSAREPLVFSRVAV
jgi:hypothetical protein